MDVTLEPISRKTQQERCRASSERSQAKAARRRDEGLLAIRDALIEEPDLSIDDAARLVGVHPVTVGLWLRYAEAQGEPVPLRKRQGVGRAGSRNAPPRQPPQRRCGECLGIYDADLGVCPNAGCGVPVASATAARQHQFLQTIAERPFAPR